MFSTWRQRFWLGGLALAILIIVALVMDPLLPAEKRVDRRSMGLDFVAFYTAGTFARQGRAAELYDVKAIGAYQKQLAAENNLDLEKPAAWWNPPVFAVVLEPLAMLPFRAAYWAWLGVNVACLAGAVWILMGFLPAAWGWGYRGLVPLLVCVSMPAIQAIGHGQNSCISLLILALGVKLALRGKGLWAGVGLGLLGYKPQIAVAAAVIVGLMVNWRVWIGFAGMGVAILAMNMILLPGTLHSYVANVGGNLHAIQTTQSYIWERQVTAAGFWRLLLQGRGVGETSNLVRGLTVLTEVGIAGMVLWGWWIGRSKNDENQMTNDELNSGDRTSERLACQYLAAVRSTALGGAIQCGPSDAPLNIVLGRSFGIRSLIRHSSFEFRHSNVNPLVAGFALMPVMMPYFLDYDLLLLSVPAVLYAAKAMERPSKWGAGLWTALYLSLWVNAGVGKLVHLDLAVLLMCTTGAYLVWSKKNAQMKVANGLIDESVRLAA
ncbi:MAG TPA: glycosyltransferase family 87 protein [Tepidisphaeraceae bacterium]|jgi:hypothetical protein